jgi:hypothetical protein
MRARQRHLNPKAAGAKIVLDSRYIDQADNTAITSWADRSGNAYNAAQGDNTKQPTFQTNEIGGNGAVRFDGSNDSLQATSVILPCHISAIVVQSSTRTGSNLKFWFEHSANTNSNSGCFFNGTYGGAWAYNRNSGLTDGPSRDNTDWIGSGWSIASHSYDGTGIIYKNGVLVSDVTFSGTARSNTDATQALNIGARNQASLFLNGDIAQIVIVPVASNSLRRRLENAASYSFKIACS